jgi:cytochrome c556
MHKGLLFFSSPHFRKLAAGTQFSGEIMRVLVGFLTAALAVSAAADDNAVKYRQHTMDAVGGHMQALAEIVKGEVDHKDHIAVHASSLAALSGIVPDVFGADSKTGADTEALPKIWEQPDAFKQRLDAFRTAAQELDAVAKSGDATKLGAAFGALGKSCKGCHDDFKKKD